MTIDALRSLGDADFSELLNGVQAIQCLPNDSNYDRKPSSPLWKNGRQNPLHSVYPWDKTSAHCAIFSIDGPRVRSEIVSCFGPVGVDMSIMTPATNLDSCLSSMALVELMQGSAFMDYGSSIPRLSASMKSSWILLWVVCRSYPLVKVAHVRNCR